jgi:hypothetical protein
LSVHTTFTFLSNISHFISFRQNFEEIDNDENEVIKPTEIFSMKKIVVKVDKKDKYLEKGREEGKRCSEYKIPELFICLLFD